jgi:hypothetical protein
MCRRLVYFTTFTLVASLILTSAAEAVDPIGWWQLDDGAGLTAVDLFGEHDGELTGPLTWVEGMYGGALQFVGGNGSPFVDLGAWQTDGPEGLSLCLWAKWDGTNGLYQGFLSQREGTMYWWTELNPEGTQLRFKSNTNPQSNIYLTGEHLIEGEWAHLAFIHDAVENTGMIYFNGEERLNGEWDLPAGDFSNLRIGIGVVNTADGLGTFNGTLDDVMIFQVPLSQDEVLAAMEGGGGGYPLARSPDPSDGAFHEDTWVTLSWKPGDFAVSHDVYLGDNLSDVEQATPDSDVFRGNQATDFYIAGFPGYAYPDGLVPGTTYYWRIDEVNDADPNSPWKGDIWSFSIPPKTAYDPIPADGTGLADTTVTLRWTPGFGAKMHTVYLGDDYDQVSNATVGVPTGGEAYAPGPLEREKVYYWRVDEFDGLDTFKGDVWTFTTPGAVGNPQPANGATDVAMAAILSWTAADNAASHQLYLGTDKAAVRNAETGASEYKGAIALGEESYDPGLLDLGTTYYWRVDEVYNGNPVKGPIWSFTVGDYLIVDDFESYTDNDAEGEAVWQMWIDGFGVADNGAQAGNLLPPYCEQTIVHGGDQSMPLFYVNDAGVTNSEVARTLTAGRDWTAGGVVELSLWFRGDSANVPQGLYVAVSNAAGAPAILANDDPLVAQTGRWTQWVIPLQTFADRGINLTDVDKIAIGLGSKSGAASAGGSGVLYVDDIRLYRP